MQALPAKPAFMLHTGDITHLSKAEQFDNAEQIIGGAGFDVHYVPGEHDIVDEGTGKAYLERYGKNTKGSGWYSFDQNGVHFIGLVNVVNLKAGGLGYLGAGAARMARRRPEGRSAIDADRRLRAHPALVGLSRMGLGHGRRGTGARVSSSASAR